MAFLKETLHMKNKENNSSDDDDDVINNDYAIARELQTNEDIELARRTLASLSCSSHGQLQQIINSVSNLNTRPGATEDAAAAAQDDDRNEPKSNVEPQDEDLRSSFHASYANINNENEGSTDAEYAKRVYDQEMEHQKQVNADAELARQLEQYPENTMGGYRMYPRSYVPMLMVQNRHGQKALFQPCGRPDCPDCGRYLALAGFGRARPSDGGAQRGRVDTNGHSSNAAEGKSDPGGTVGNGAVQGARGGIQRPDGSKQTAHRGRGGTRQHAGDKQTNLSPQMHHERRDDRGRGIDFMFGAAGRTADGQRYQGTREQPRGGQSRRGQPGGEQPRAQRPRAEQPGSEQPRGEQPNGAGARDARQGVMFFMPPRGPQRPRHPRGIELLAEGSRVQRAFTRDEWAGIQGNPYNLVDLLGNHQAARRRMQRADIDGADYESLLALAEMLGEVKKRGLDPQEIDLMPTIKFKDAEEAGAESGDGDKEQCKICLCEFIEGERLRTLPCLHCFHQACIDKWITSNAVCPVCRIEIKEALKGREGRAN